MSMFKRIISISMVLAMVLGITSFTPVTAEAANIADGVWAVEFSVYNRGTTNSSGANGMKVSPARLAVKDGAATVTLGFDASELSAMALAVLEYDGVSASYQKIDGVDYFTFSPEILESGQVDVRGYINSTGNWYDYTVQFDLDNLEPWEGAAYIPDGIWTVNYDVYNADNTAAGTPNASMKVSPARLEVADGVTTVTIGFNDGTMAFREITHNGETASYESKDGVDYFTFSTTMPETGYVVVSGTMTADMGTGPVQMGPYTYTLRFDLDSLEPKLEIPDGVWTIEYDVYNADNTAVGTPNNTMKVSPARLVAADGVTTVTIAFRRVAMGNNSMAMTEIIYDGDDAEQEEIDGIDYFTFSPIIPATGYVTVQGKTTMGSTVTTYTLRFKLDTLESLDESGDGVYTIAYEVWNAGNTQTAVANNMRITPARMVVADGVTTVTIGLDARTQPNMAFTKLEYNGEEAARETIGGIDYFTFSPTIPETGLVSVIGTMGMGPFTYTLRFDLDSVVPWVEPVYPEFNIGDVVIKYNGEAADSLIALPLTIDVTFSAENTTGATPFAGILSLYGKDDEILKFVSVEPDSIPENDETTVSFTILDGSVSLEDLHNSYIQVLMWDIVALQPITEAKTVVPAAPPEESRQLPDGSWLTPVTVTNSNAISAVMSSNARVSVEGDTVYLTLIFDSTFGNVVHATSIERIEYNGTEAERTVVSPGYYGGVSSVVEFKFAATDLQSGSLTVDIATSGASPTVILDFPDIARIPLPSSPLPYGPWNTAVVASGSGMVTPLVSNTARVWVDENDGTVYLAITFEGSGSMFGAADVASATYDDGALATRRVVQTGANPIVEFAFTPANLQTGTLSVSLKVSVVDSVITLTFPDIGGLNLPDGSGFDISDSIAPGSVFIFDELEDNSNEDTGLYTLRFVEDDGYLLTANAGRGVIAKGTVSGGANGEIAFANGLESDDDFTGRFDSYLNRISVSYDEKDMTFITGISNPEFPYLEVIGAFSTSDEHVLILERFYEFFLYDGEDLIRGTYEILKDGTVEFTNADGADFTGTMVRGNVPGVDFYLPSTKITIDGEDFNFYATPNTKTFIAPHGMREYHLSLLPADMFIIYGNDGPVRGLGTLDMDFESSTGVATYFLWTFVQWNGDTDAPEVEFRFTYDEEYGQFRQFNFPQTTPLLPLSGNISADTGKGSFYTSGQILYFDQLSETDDEIAAYEPFDLSGTVTIDGSPAADVAVYKNGEYVSATGADGAFNAHNDGGAAYMYFEKEGHIFSFHTVTEDTDDLAVTGRAHLGPMPNVTDRGNEFARATGTGITMPSRGMAKPLVLLLEFPDIRRDRHATPEALTHELFDISNPASYAAWYYRSSYGQLAIEGTVLPWYRAENNRSYYEGDSGARIMQEAIQYHIDHNGLDLDEYDFDGDGRVDSLLVMWSGAPTERPFDGAFRSTWGRSFDSFAARFSGFTFNPSSTVWSAIPPLSISTPALVHETGHLLGLVDYYSTQTLDRGSETASNSGGATAAGLGTMDMMDSNLGDHNSYSKWLVGWMDPQVTSVEEIAEAEEQTFTIKPFTEHSDALFVKLGNSTDTLHSELFVIEAINKENNGAAWGRLTEPVVRILHIEGTRSGSSTSSTSLRYNNVSVSDKKLASIVEADGKDFLLNFFQRGGNDKANYSRDMFFKAGGKITPNTYPTTNKYDDYGNRTVYTGLTIEVVSIDADGTAVIKLGYEEESPEQIADKLTLESVTPDRWATHTTTATGANRQLALNETVFEFTFNHDIEFADGATAEDAMESIIIYSGLAFIDDGWNVAIEGNKLTIIFDENLVPYRSYRIILPQGLLQEKDNPANVNLSLRSGFATVQ